MPLLPFIFLFVIVASITCAFGYKRFAKPSTMLDQLVSSTSIDKPTDKNSTSLEEKKAEGFLHLLDSLGRALPYAPQSMKLIGKELTAAGYRHEYCAYVFVALKIVGCVGILAIAILLRTHLASSTLSLRMIPMAGAIGGYLLPGLILGRLVRHRREAIRLALPDALDLMVISTEAGCALDKAILNVSREFRAFHPEISEELSLVNMEMLAGGSRTEALRNFAHRTGEEELKKLVAILIQTDRFGTSIADALRTQSEFMRVKRRQIAEERAGKVGVKLVFPIFFFCMPALTVVVAGPGFLQLFKALPTLAGLH